MANLQSASSLFADAIAKAAPVLESVRRVFLPLGTAPADAHRLRKAGWIVVAGLTGADDNAVEAKRLGCDHVLTGAGAEPGGDLIPGSGLRILATDEHRLTQMFFPLRGLPSPKAK